MIDLSEELEIAIGLGLSRGMEALKQAAIVESSGACTKSDLRKLDHPYATRHAKPLLDPSRINTHDPSGFISFWKVEPTVKQSDGLLGLLVNNSPIADFLVGKDRPKSKMVRRPIDDELEATAPLLIEARVNLAIQDFERRDFVL